MVKVRMVAQRTGGRYDGQDWPGPGGVIDVRPSEAEHLIGTGDAVAAEETPPKRGPGRPPKTAPAGDSAD